MDDYKPQEQMFDVVCLKAGVNVLTAAPDDFKRIAVQAPDPLAAQMHDDVRKSADGFTILFSAPPGVMTDPEIQARVRVMSPMTDRSKI